MTMTKISLRLRNDDPTKGAVDAPKNATDAEKNAVYEAKCAPDAGKTSSDAVVVPIKGYYKRITSREKFERFMKSSLWLRRWTLFLQLISTIMLSSIVSTVIVASVYDRFSTNPTVETTTSVSASSVDSTSSLARVKREIEFSEPRITPQLVDRLPAQVVIDIKNTLEDIRDRLTHEDFMNPNFSCPNSNQGAYQHVGPPRYWSSCYYIHDKRLTFDRAVEFCRRSGGYLVQIESQEETDYVNKLVEAYTRYWIGAKRDMDTGSFRWVESGEELTYSNWDTKDLTDEECGYLYRGDWEFESCLVHTIHVFVCEAPVVNARSSALQEDEEEEPEVKEYESQVTNSTYLFVEAQYPWEKARRFCKGRGGFLANVESSSENADLTRFAKSTYQSSYMSRKWWLGGFETPETEWKWVESGRNFSSGFTDWRPRLKSVERRACLSLYTALYFGYSWEKTDCLEWHRFICEIPSNNSKGDGSFENLEPPKPCVTTNFNASGYSNTVLNCFTLVPLQKTEKEARDYCESELGRSLAELTEENAAQFASMLKPNSFGREVAFWWFSRKVATSNAPRRIHFDLIINGSYVCSGRYNQRKKNGRVYCRQMGFSDFSQTSQPNYRFVQNFVRARCVGDETHLRHCPLEYTEECEHGYREVTAVECVDEPLDKCLRVEHSADNGLRGSFVDCDHVAWFVCQDPPKSIRSEPLEGDYKQFG